MCGAHASPSANVGLGLHDKLLQPQSARAYDSIQVYKVFESLPRSEDPWRI